MKKTYIIGEIGLNSIGSLDITKKLIDIAAVAGVDSIKLQKRHPDVCVPEHQKSVMKDTPWGRMTYLEYKYKVEFGQDDYDEIDIYCRQKGIDWSASPWDMDSLNFLLQYDIPWIKIPSAMLTNDELLVASAKTGKKVILSTGMSEELEITRAVEILRKYTDNDNFAILHCNSTYPAPTNELNLSCIKTLKEKYNCEVGYSGHEFRLGTSVAAIYLGATIIERHITLSRDMWGSDQLCSVEPQGLIKMCRGIRELEEAYGDGVLGVTESEKPVRKKLRG